ncbi:branched-chain amino acid ABC transporter permease [Amycolatopsis coloradensis]|uniref:Branched-chain amino acid transport system permease protein n=2 Tax=Amycolatopsis TaxID=1813 RepID=R4SWK9_9PSEU|nr:branched-chain amino acid transport system permease protein [Amycolatopsis keratiniphila]RSN17220.1 branched-chain amino acid ABC transporter permease [Streptomyces sp. WAC 05977]RSN32513.1 branched-chain amino acid ABC transporter permease [Amycolatopsis sp. WAC 04169]
MKGNEEVAEKSPENGKPTRAGFHPVDGMRDWWARAPHWQRYGVYIALIIGALILPAPAIGSFMSPESDWTTVLIFPVGVYILLAIGLNIVVGHAGMLDLGFVAFFAIGAYTLAVMGTLHGWGFWGTLVLGIFLAAMSGVILGAPTLRLRGDYLAIVTLGFGEIVRITATNTDAIGGARGITNIPHPEPMFGTEFLLDPAPYYYLILAAIVIAIIFSVRLHKSRVGRAWAAIREDEDAAELMGVPTFKFKLLAFAIGAMLGGMAGVVYASKAVFIEPNNFPFILSATILAAVVLGGAGNLPGVMLGAFLVAWLPERFRFLSEYRILIFGGVLVLMMALRPEGLLPSRQRKAELHEGTGGMGAMGAEVAGPDSEASAEVTK